MGIRLFGKTAELKNGFYLFFFNGGVVSFYSSEPGKHRSPIDVYIGEKEGYKVTGPWTPELLDRIGELTLQTWVQIPSPRNDIWSFEFRPAT